MRRTMLGLQLFLAGAVIAAPLAAAPAPGGLALAVPLSPSARAALMPLPGAPLPLVVAGDEGARRRALAHGILLVAVPPLPSCMAAAERA